MRALFLLLPLIAAVATAQIPPERYYPFEPGDTWTHAAELSGGATCSADYTVLRYDHAEVLRDTVVSGEAWAVAACTSFAPDGAWLGTSEYVARPVTALTLDVHETLREGGCGLLSTPVFSSTNEQGAGEVEIGGFPYAVDGLFSTGTSGTGSGGTQTSYSFQAAADIGPLFEVSFSSRSSPPTCSSRRKRLMYAEVGGLTYGANPVGQDAAPPAVSAFSVTAAPSPAHTFATVHVTARSPARVEVFDLLGRRVYRAEAGSAALRVDVSAWPAGHYVVRAVTEDAETSTRLVVAH